ncbi:LAME_0F18228g1_1 [Lachancea meyersii CBS 8951]|uniref:LAME_0F18228g1_1 n=1 Tax=Lachancea meyersii CBS 8951 TaxID=1266667 RepID=A0A1G4K0J4_9SACH|nr:LAME_0F18228g1_1 [Lachancea meyersii CBS 8951]
MGSTRMLQTSLPYKRVVDLAFKKFKPTKLNPSSPSNPVVVNLHGLFGSGRSFSAVGRRMAQDLNTEVYNLDLRNHGQSPLARPYNYLTLTEDVVNFLHHQFGGERPISIVGFSLGGRVGLLTTLSRRINIVKCISIDMPPYRVSSLSDVIMQNYSTMLKLCDRTLRVEKGVKSWKDDILKVFRALPANTDPGVALYFAQGFLEVKKNEEPYDPATDVDPYVDYKLPLCEMTDLIDIVKDCPAIEMLEPGKFKRTTQASVLFMRGLQSPLFRDSFSALSDFYPNHSVVEFNTGHIIMNEAPEQCYKSCIEHLKD